MNMMKIQVTKEHIKKGKPDNVKCCAVALALQEKLGGDFHVKVLAEDFIITNKEVEIKNHIVPSSKKQEVINFISDFDYMSEYERLNELKPIEFELEIEGRK